MTMRDVQELIATTRRINHRTDLTTINLVGLFSEYHGILDSIGGNEDKSSIRKDYFYVVSITKSHHAQPMGPRIFFLQWG